MNKKILKSFMVLYDDTNQTLADALNITPQTLSAKINQTKNAEFTQQEICIIRDRYHLTNAETISIFFADNVS